ncbi:hypothetical protein MWU54_12595 [Marivita sp. S6314]|uniref:hypothetical protein n=1 Tax=Marivita sp. S6314 TaxID=2926406 RepID=UPI001FF5AF8C|nr:hypothetical protein [Marivita sp. S6314]MCK0150870.1 hypothetical protein [Marivita sp. S6314]
MLSTRVVNLLVYAALSALSALVIWSVSGLPVTLPGDVGTHFFPTILAWGVIILCAIGAIRSLLSGAGEAFRIDYLPRVLLTIGMIAGFFVSWSQFGAFYLQAFVFLFVLFTYYRLPVGLSAKLIGVNAAVALGITAFCYVAFNFLIYVDL